MIELFVHSFGLRFHYRHKPGFDIFAFIDRAAATGFSGINVSAYGPDFFELSGGDPAHAARVRKHLEARGLKIDIETNGTDAEHLGKLMELADRLGAGQIRTYTRRRGTPAGHSADRHEESGARPPPTLEERIAQAVSDLREVGPLAERAGINILLENHEELAGTEVAAILREVDHPHIRAVYDYGNSMVFLEEPLDALDIMARWVGTAHLKDHVMLAEGMDGIDRPNIMGVPVGQGNLPVVDITKRLVAAGLKRICFENVWAYRTPLRVKRGRGVLGQGAFAYRRPPFRPWQILPDPDAVARRDPGELVALEDRAFNESVGWLARNFAEAGIALAQPLRPV
ncbi:MAG: sugar phosphate isomerase/epimerase [Alphaproteobacteria bacterium]|nr:sugar phosphate isomerase/epimerase [Alphaproteobacteria bacterium]